MSAFNIGQIMIDKQLNKLFLLRRKLHLPTLWLVLIWVPQHVLIWSQLINQLTHKFHSLKKTLRIFFIFKADSNIQERVFR